MARVRLIGFALPLPLFLGLPAIASGSPRKLSDSHAQSGTLQRMIVETGSVTMQLDLDRLAGSGLTSGKLEGLHFAIAANSFFSILVFNDVLRGPEKGSMTLLPQAGVNAPGYSALPVSLAVSLQQLVVERLSSPERFDLAVRDAKTGFTFFNIEGHQYDYDAKGQLLSIQGGRLMMSKEFANSLGRPSSAGSVVGRISVGAGMRPIEITHVVNGEPKSITMPPLNRSAAPGTPTQPQGPDVIVGDLQEMSQYGSDESLVGLGIGTTSCNNGTQPVDWYAFPDLRHPVIPQNFYRMSGGRQ